MAIVHPNQGIDRRRFVAFLGGFGVAGAAADTLWAAVSRGPLTTDDIDRAARIAGLELSDEKAVVAAHRQAADHELGLTLTIGAILRGSRGILTPEQVLAVREIVAEVSEASDLRFLDFQEQLAAGELLVPTSRSSGK